MTRASLERIVRELDAAIVRAHTLQAGTEDGKWPRSAGLLEGAIWSAIHDLTNEVEAEKFNEKRRAYLNAEEEAND